MVFAGLYMCFYSIYRNKKNTPHQGWHILLSCECVLSIDRHIMVVISKDETQKFPHDRYKSSLFQLRNISVWPKNALESPSTYPALTIARPYLQYVP